MEDCIIPHPVETLKREPGWNYLVNNEMITVEDSTETEMNSAEAEINSV